MHISDDIRLGPVYGPANDYLSSGNPAPMELGAGPMGRVYFFDAVPVTSGAALLAALQTTAGAAALVLTPGAGVTSAQYPDGTTRLTLDYARRLTLTSAANLSAINFVVRGYDAYGQPLSQLLAGPNANTVATLKTFKQILSVTSSAAVGTNMSVGFNDALGLPYAIRDAAYAFDPGWANVFARDGGTLVNADVTSPATQATGDVRGVYTPSSAANGARRLVFGQALTAIQCGPQANRIGMLGVDNV